MAKASVKGGVTGLYDAKGTVGGGFKPWPKGQYAFQCVDSVDDKPTKNGDWMLYLKLECIGTTADEKALAGRDPTGKTFHYRCILQPQTDNFERQRETVKNVANGFGVKIDKATDYFKGGANAFIGKKAACNLNIGKVKKGEHEGEDEQKWYEWFTMADSEFTEE